MNRLAKIYTSAGIVLPSIGWDLRPTFNDRNIFFFVISRVYVSVCVSFFFFPPHVCHEHTRQHHWEDIYSWIRNYTVAATLPFRTIGCVASRGPGESYTATPSLVLPLGLHTVSLIFHGFSALFFFLPPSLLAMQMLSIFELQNAKCAFK